MRQVLLQAKKLYSEEILRELSSLSEDGKDKEALELQHSLLAANKAVTAQFGVPGLKHIMDQLGFYGGPVRRPLVPLKDENLSVLTEAFAPFQ